jgi:hypothetical protein
VIESGSHFLTCRLCLSTLPNAKPPRSTFAPVCIATISTQFVLVLSDSVGTLDPEDYHHYALSTDCYTHFTSPIRRYSDVVVHRLLFSALEKRRT